MKLVETLTQSNLENKEHEDFKEIKSISQAIDAKIIELQKIYTVDSIRVISGVYGESALVELKGIDVSIRLPKYIVPMLEKVDGFELNRNIPIDGILNCRFYQYHNDQYNKDCFGVAFK